jgi:hypothetical protein
MTNPFAYGRVVDASQYCTRPQVEKSLKSMMESGQNAVLFGERRIGKTSLILHVAKKLRKSRMVYFDFLACHTPGELTERIVRGVFETPNRSFFNLALKIFASLRLTVTIDPQTGAPSASMGTQPTSRSEAIDNLETALDQLYTLHKEKPLIVVFDEFQQVLAIPGGDQVLARMRSRIQMHATLPYVFSGSIREDMQKIFSDHKSPFYKSALPLEIQAIERKRFDSYLTKRFAATNRQIDSAVFDEIYNLGIQVTGDIQQMCWALWMSSSSGDTIGSNKIDEALELLFAMESRNFEDTVTVLAPSQLKVLNTLASNKFSGLYSNEFKQRSGILNNQTIGKAVQRLENLRILFLFKGKPRISNPFFALWLKRKF